MKTAKKPHTEYSAATRLSKKLHYKFSDPALLIEAVTHRSKHSINNERLEFLGDSILGYVISSELFQRFPEAREGQLTRGRAVLVRGETLAELALNMDLGDYLNLGPGELKSGGHQRKSILADAMEAIIGAIYLDGGLDAARQHILAIYADKLQALSLEEVNKDPKTRLQEYLQARKQPLPDYEVVTTTGSEHEQVFEISCKVSVLPRVVIGTGRSRRTAEQEAAGRALKLLEEADNK
ncbi:MAG: ribonuclease III [Gammaproteobacteria bacterium]|nr:ribonuclease III [Gammaproteobacteria bacterium]